MEKDELQQKINSARSELSLETRQAIDSIDWKGALLKIKDTKSYNLEQLDDLETETELLLCGLTNPKDFPKEIGTRMQISKEEVNTLVNEMNELIFKKIREKLMADTSEKSSDRLEQKETQTLNKAGIEIMPEEITASDSFLNKEKVRGGILEQRDTLISDVENPDLIKTPSIIPSQKLTGSFSMPTKKTEYTVNNISKTPDNSKTSPIPTPTQYKKVDPYREIPE